MPPPPRAMLLDLGGTVLEERSYDLAAGVRELLRNPAFPTRRTPAEEGEALRELSDAIDAVHRTNRAEFTLARWLEDQLEPATPTAVAQAELALWRRVAHLEPMPGVDEALGALRDEGLALAVVSNAVFVSATLAAELTRHELSAAFAFVLSSADLGVRKPDPGIFREALARLGAQPRDTWFVGDSFRNDVAGAHAAGMTAVWLSATGEPDDPAIPHHRARDWPELLALYRSSRR